MERRIQVQLKDIVKSDKACSFLGLNPWCVAEGANGNIYYQIELDKAREFDLV